MSVHTGQSGQIELTGSKAGITVLVDWVETYNTDTNTSTVTITKVQGKSSQWYGISYFLKGSIAIDGVNLITFNEDHYLDCWDKLNTFQELEVRDGAKPPPWGSGDIEHNEDGTKTVNITFSFTGITDSGSSGSGWEVDEVVPVTLTNIPVPEPEPDPDIPVPEPEPEPKEPVMIFAYDGELVLFPRYEGKIVSFIIVPPVLGTKTTVAGTVIRVDDVRNTGHLLEIHATEGTEVKVYGKNLFNIPDRVVRDFGALANTTQRTFTENSIYLNLALNNYCNVLHKMQCEIVSDNSFTVLTPSNSAGGWEGYGAGFNFRVTPNTAYSVSASYDNTKGELAGCNFYDENGNYISNTTNTQNVKIPANCAWMNVIFRVRLRDEAVLFENVQLEVNATVTEYEAYKGVQTATTDENGKVTSLKSVAPTMTIVGEEPVECTYYATD